MTAKSNTLIQRFFMAYVLCCAALMLVSVTASAAGEDALYAPTAPAGSAFIRVVNASSGTALDSVTIGGKTLSNIQPLQVTPYIFLKPGQYNLAIGPQTHKSLTLAASTFYTAVRGPKGKVTLIQDHSFHNPRKALIAFYNLMPDNTLSLRTRDGKVTVVKGVKAMATGDREINAVKITLAAYGKGKALASFTPVSLQRGKVFSFFVIDVGGAPRLLVVENRVDTTV